MRRVTLTFFILLGAATLASGQVWTHAGALMAGQGTVLDSALSILSVGVLIASLLGLGRILHRTTPVPPGR